MEIKIYNSNNQYSINTDLLTYIQYMYLVDIYHQQLVKNTNDSYLQCQCVRNLMIL